jgi:hypothetical protein
MASDLEGNSWFDNGRRAFRSGVARKDHPSMRAVVNEWLAGWDAAKKQSKMPVEFMGKPITDWRKIAGQLYGNDIGIDPFSLEFPSNDARDEFRSGWFEAHKRAALKD